MLRKTLFLAMMVSFACGGAALAGDSQVPPELQEGAAFKTIEADEADSPETARLKAALRLLSVYMAVLDAGKACGASDTAAAMKHYVERNGTTSALVAGAIKKSGTGARYKAATDERTAELAKTLKARDCGAFLKDVANGRFDLYKGPGLADDYKLMRAQ